MNTTELIDKLAAEAGLTKADSKKALEATVSVIKAALAAGDKVQLVGFGIFVVAEHHSRDGFNPRSGDKITISASNVIKFNAGAEFAEAINKSSVSLDPTKNMGLRFYVPILFSVCFLFGLISISF